MEEDVCVTARGLGAGGSPSLSPSSPSPRDSRHGDARESAGQGRGFGSFRERRFKSLEEGGEREGGFDTSVQRDQMDPTARKRDLQVQRRVEGRRPSFYVLPEFFTVKRPSC